MPPSEAITFLRRGRDSNPRYRFKPVQRFSKPALSATQAPLRIREAKIKIKAGKSQKTNPKFQSVTLEFGILNSLFM
jgi:hypothetical protein